MKRILIILACCLGILFADQKLADKPYTSKPKYIDATNSHVSNFIFAKEINDWQRYINANIADNLEYCPAPGKANADTKKPLKRNKRGLEDDFIKEANIKPLMASNVPSSHKIVRSLPPGFKITEDWIRRFWEISTTTRSGTSPFIGVCGVCLLHSYQIVAELQEYAITGAPPRGRG